MQEVGGSIPPGSTIQFQTNSAQKKWIQLNAHFDPRLFQRRTSFLPSIL
jgi:hypothetical protein